MRPRSVGPLLAALSALLVPGQAYGVDPQIAALQVALSAKRFYAGTIDGIAGSATTSAVRSLQRQAGVRVDGRAGPRTRAALGVLGRHAFGSRLLRRGAVGWDVALLQFVLAAHGASPGTLDGRFGPRTEAALVRLQRRSKLTPDGIVGPTTISRLCPNVDCTSLPRSLLGVRTSHRVRRGETLASIAERYGTTVAALEQANEIRRERPLERGTKLRLPRLAPQAAWPDEDVSRAAVKALLRRSAQRAAVAPSLARAVAWMESGYQPNVRSSTGEWGVMQVRPETWDFVESAVLRRSVPHDTAGNIRVGTAYLGYLLRHFGAHRRLAVAAYHQGLAAVHRFGVLPDTEHYVEVVDALEHRLSK